jgi:hypothetical protein
MRMLLLLTGTVMMLIKANYGALLILLGSRRMILSMKGCPACYATQAVACCDITSRHAG